MWRLVWKTEIVNEEGEVFELEQYEDFDFYDDYIYNYKRLQGFEELNSLRGFPLVGQWAEQLINN